MSDFVCKMETRDVCHVVEFNEDAKSTLYGKLRILLVGNACVLYCTLYTLHTCDKYMFGKHCLPRLQTRMKREH